MSTGFWIAVILTSPFWMILGIVITYFIFVLGLALLMVMFTILAWFISLFEKKEVKNRD